MQRRSHIIEIEREVDENDPTFKNGAKISIDQARVNVLTIHPGKVVNEEKKLGWTDL